jgi:hypothetical protein
MFSSGCLSWSLARASATGRQVSSDSSEQGPARRRSLSGWKIILGCLVKSVCSPSCKSVAALAECEMLLVFG